ncbi:MAG: SsrA-binding protein SmpB [Actinomycetota bacterium]
MAAKKRARKEGGNVVAGNPKARHDFHISETYETGIVLTGSEVKSLRQGRASLRESFAVIRNNEVFLIGMHIPPYPQAGYMQHDPTRTRKLLLHKEEIERLVGRTKERGLTLVPLNCYFDHGLAKVELGLAKGKKLYDKRETMKEKDSKMAVDRYLRRRR